VTTDLKTIIDLDKHPLLDPNYQEKSRSVLERDGVLVMPGFLRPEAVAAINAEGEANQEQAFFTNSQHNVYLLPSEHSLPKSHPRNRLVTSTKGCITTDQIPAKSPLKNLYQADEFRSFLCTVLSEQALYEYADPLSSINLHYAGHGQELGWHFDNSSFAITLLIQKPEQGGVFEYRKDARDDDNNDMNYELVDRVLDKQEPVQLVVLAYNTEPGVELSESARMTFYGRLQ